VNLRAVIGLGNPGKDYAMTRHNLGFMVVERLAAKLSCTLRFEARFEGWRAKASLRGSSFELLMPATYMNESGRSAQKLLSYFQIAPSEILVVVDDMALDFGRMRLRALGSAGGHNGLKSLMRDLGTHDFARLRIGIGKAPSKHRDHVLDSFTKEEETALDAILDRAVTDILRLPFEEFSKVAGDVNRQEDLKNKDVL
jgi:peptidyl-tRNA hydrolase, PTH1 family